MQKQGSDELAHIHSVYDTDNHFMIDGITRTVKNVSETKTMVVQHDHNSERFTFEIPRMVDGHDMSTCNVVQVHYINIDAKTQEQSNGVYEADDLQISPNDEGTVILSWLISSNATKYVGKLNFVIRFVCSSDGEVDYAWNTAVYSGVSVYNGICNTDAVAEEYADVLEQWRNAIEEAVEVSEGKVDKSGWTGNKLLGTDADGNVIETDPGLTEVDWEDVKNRPFYEDTVSSQTTFATPPTVSFDAAGNTWWKCSDLAPTREQFLSSVIEHGISADSSLTETPTVEKLALDEENFTGVLFADTSGFGYVVCRTTGTHTVNFMGNPLPVTVPETGIYWGCPTGQTPPETFHFKITYEKVTTLDAKYLPMDAIEEKINEALGVIENGTY